MDSAHTPDHWAWREAPVAHPGQAVVFDMDGVLSDASSRQHFLDHPMRDWDAFFAACGEDALIDEVARLLDVIDPTFQVVLLVAGVSLAVVLVRRVRRGWARLRRWLGRRAGGAAPPTPATADEPTPPTPPAPPPSPQS